VISNPALRRPGLVGKKLTLIIQLLPGAKLEKQLVLIEKSPASGPVRAISLMNRSAEPRLLSVMMRGSLLWPTCCGPKSNSEGSKAATGAGVDEGVRVLVGVWIMVGVPVGLGVAVGVAVPVGVEVGGSTATSVAVVVTTLISVDGTGLIRAACGQKDQVPHPPSPNNKKVKIDIIRKGGTGGVGMILMR
jgi:hypothetical protein